MLAIFHSHWIAQRRSQRDHIFIESTSPKLPDPGRVETQARKEKSEQSQTKTSIYPNPTSGEIVVYLEEKGILNIYNQNGMLVRNFSLEKGQQTLDLNLPAGVYMITDNNSIQEKLVIID